MSGISLLLLGEISVVVDGDLRRLSGQRQRAVLAYLCLRASRHVGVDQLIDALWGDRQPKTARNSIQRFVSDIRRALGPFAERLETVPDGYRLMASPEEIDVSQAMSTIAEGRAAMSAGNPAEAVAKFQRALALWTGPALSGLGDADFAAGEIAQLEEVRMSTIEDAIEAELALGRHREIAGTVESFARENRTRERAWLLLMLARYRCERQADALAAYHELREHLADELGVEPAPSVEELHLQILEQVPELDPPAVSAGDADLVLWSLDAPFAIPLPRPLERFSRFPMSGRLAEFATITAARDAVVDSGPRVLFIAGEAGIGKTRLVSEVAARFRREGVSVLYGRCEEDLAAPYQPWVDALEHLVRHAPASLLQRHREQFGDPLSVLVPGMRPDRVREDVSAGTERAEIDNDGHRQAMLFRAVAGMLELAAAQRPVLLILDDLQWADSSSLKLMRYVATRTSSPLLVIGAYRDTDVGDSHPLTDSIGVLQRASTVELITLGGLSDQATNELVDFAVAGEHSGRNREIAAAIRQETNGNPFFITEILPSFIENEAISTSEIEGFLRDELPESIGRVLRQRISRLGEPAARALRAASVFGREFELDLLAAILEGTELDVLDLVETAIRARLVTDAPTGRDRFSFTHDIIAHYLYNEMSQSRRGRTHARIADAIESNDSGALGDRVEQLATHLVAAADPEQRERTLDACRGAGERAAAAYAPTEAVLWFQQALAQLAKQADPGEALRAALLVQLGTQQRNAGDKVHWSTLTKAGRLALEIGEVDTLVASVLANSRSLNARTWEVDEERIELLRAALDALGPVETAERANLLASLANEQWDADHRSEAESLYRESMTLARQVGDPTTLATALIRVSRARNFRLGRDEMHAISREIGELVARGEITDPLVGIYCMTTVLNTALQLCLADDVANAIQAIFEAERLAKLPVQSNSAHVARILVAGLRGDAAEYERLATRMFEMLSDTGVATDERMSIFEGQLFYSRFMQGRMNELSDAIANIIRERPDVALYRAVAALIHAEARLFDEATSLIDREVARGFEPPIDMFSIQSLTLWAEAAASAGHLEGCRILRDMLAPFSTEMAGHLVQVTEPIDLALGRMCTCIGLYEDAAAHFDIAGTIADDFDGLWMRARADLNRAQMFAARNAAGDPKAACSFAQRAHGIASAQGYAAIQRDAGLVLGEFEPSPPTHLQSET